MFISNLPTKLVAGIYLTGLTGMVGCTSLSGGVVDEIPKNKVENRGFEGPSDSITGEGGLLSNLLNGNSESAANALPVNKYLWRASLDTLSFLPLASTDPFSGVIATEWGASPDAPNERVRVTAIVEGTKLSAQAVDVTVFRETLNPAGAWIAATVNPQTASQVKDQILTRARELRIQNVDGTVL